MIIGVFIWLILSFIVGLIARNKKIGFWGGFFISLLLTPFIGFIIALVSGSSRPLVIQSESSLKLAQKAEFRGDKDEAIKRYKDVLFELNDAPKTTDKHKINHRSKTRMEVEQKIKELSS